MGTKRRLVIHFILITMAGLSFTGCKSDGDEENIPSTRLTEEQLFEEGDLARLWTYQYEGDKVSLSYVLEPVGRGNWDTIFHKVFTYPDDQTIVMTYYDHGTVPAYKYTYSLDGDKVTGLIGQAYEGDQWKDSYGVALTYQGGLISEWIMSNPVDGLLTESYKELWSYENGKLVKIDYFMFESGEWQPAGQETYEYESGKIFISIFYIQLDEEWYAYQKDEFKFTGDYLSEIIGYVKDGDNWVPDGRRDAYEYNEYGKPSIATFQYTEDQIDRYEYTYETGMGNMAIFWYGSPEWIIPAVKQGRPVMDEVRKHFLVRSLNM